MSTQRTKEETEDELRRKTRAVPGKFAANLFEDATFTDAANRWMQGTHVAWGVFLAIMFIGFNGIVITFVEVFGVKWWQIGVTFTPVGAGYTVWQYLKYRRPKKSKATGN